MKATLIAKDHVYNSLCHLQGSGLTAKARELAAHYGVHLNTIFKWANEKGLRWRKERVDKGKSIVEDSLLMKTAALQMASCRQSKKIPLPASHAVEMLKDSGMNFGNVTTSHVLLKLREKQVSQADLLRPSPHVTLLSDHPNHVWQFDVTNCIQYFLDNDKGMGERDFDMELYKNKIVKTAKRIKKELLRYAVVDHCTGAFFFWYFYASGERSIDGADFLFKAMRPKDELIGKIFNGTSESKKNKYHFHGVPFKLIADKGSIATAKAIQALLESLRIEFNIHLPGNPRAKGAVEGLMKIINSFEARLKFQRPSGLDEINAWALDWAIMINGIKDMRRVAPRSALWSTIRSEQLRLCPEEKLYKLLMHHPIEYRTADGACLISIDGMQYRIPDTNAARKKVAVIRHPYEYPKVEVHFNGYIWPVTPIQKDIYGRLSDGVRYGEYKSPKYTETQKAKTELEKIAAEQWGLGWKGTGDKRKAIAPPVGHESPLKVFGHQADKVKVDFMNRKGTELEIKQPEMPENEPLKTDAMEVPRQIERRTAITKFLLDLKNTIGIITPALNQALRQEFGEAIEITKAEEVIREIEAIGQEAWLSNRGQQEGSREAAAG